MIPAWKLYFTKHLGDCFQAVFNCYVESVSVTNQQDWVDFASCFEGSDIKISENAIQILAVSFKWFVVVTVGLHFKNFLPTPSPVCAFMTLIVIIKMTFAWVFVHGAFHLHMYCSFLISPQCFLWVSPNHLTFPKSLSSASFTRAKDWSN